jgi:hypothetical protein
MTEAEVKSTARTLTSEQVWGEPIKPSDEPAGWGTDHYKCPECGSFTPGFHAIDCGVGRHSS